MVRVAFGFLLVLTLLTSGRAAPIVVEIGGTLSSTEVQRAAEGFVAEAANRAPDQELRILSIRAPASQVLESIRAGRSGIGILPINVLGTTSASALAQPFLYTDTDAVRRALASEVGAVVKSDFEKEGVLTLGLWSVSFTRLGVRTDIARLDDLKGKKIIVGSGAGQSARVIAELGASPISLAAAETIHAITVGVADGAVVTADSQFRSFAPAFRTIVDQPYQPVVVAAVVNAALWRGLDYQTQVSLAASARAIEKSLSSQVAAQEQQFRAFANDSGIRLAAFTAADRKASQDASLRAWDRNPANRGADHLASAVTASRLAVTASADPGRDIFPAAEQAIFFATDRVPERSTDPALMFGSRGELDRLHFGRARVVLKAGRQLDSDLDDYTTIGPIERWELADFQVRLREATSDPNTPVILFVHGYNNNFAASLQRAATIRQDIAPKAVVIAMSWPSDGSLLAYGYDESVLDVAYPNFRRMIAALDGVVGRERVTIVAHSMGSRLVLNYSDWSEGQPVRAVAKFARLVFAAPDVTVAHFRQQQVRLAAITQAVILYSSEHDRALYLSEKLHLGPRAGRAAVPDLIIQPPLVTIDASNIDKPGFLEFSFATRHSYVFDKKNGVAELSQLLSGIEVGTRSQLTRRQRGTDVFWAIRP